MIGSAMSSKLLKVIYTLLILCTTSALCEICHEKTGNLQTCQGGLVDPGLSTMSNGLVQAIITGHKHNQQLTYLPETPFEWDWDSDLQLQASDWAVQCLNSDENCRSIDKYKNVYQLTKRLYHGKKGADVDRQRVIREWFEDLSDPKDDSKRKAIRLDIVDRIGCGYAVAQRSNCSNHFAGLGVRPCSQGFYTYLVCRFASSSEKN